MAANILKKVINTTNSTITKIGIKTSSSIEKSRIKMQIESLENQIDELMKQIGEDIYSQWLGECDVLQGDVSKMEEIRKKKSEIEMLTKQFEEIDIRDNEILGDKFEYNEKISSEKKICPTCKAEYENTARFCRNCGSELTK